MYSRIGSYIKVKHDHPEVSRFTKDKACYNIILSRSSHHLGDHGDFGVVRFVILAALFLGVHFVFLRRHDHHQYLNQLCEIIYLHIEQNYHTYKYNATAAIDPNKHTTITAKP